MDDKVMEDKESSQTKAPEFDFENMKVTELKKRLKAFGLPSTGNKSDLIERLQETLSSGKGTESSADLDSALVVEDSSSPKVVEDLPIEKSTPENDMESPVIPVDQITSSAPTAVPLKKRMVPHIPRASPVKTTKKMIINRNHIPTPKIIPKSVEPVNDEADNKISIIKMEDKKVEGIKVDITDKDVPCKVIRLSAFNAKDMTEEEKIKLRAKRFNLTSTEATSKVEKVLNPLKREQIVSWKSNVSFLTPSNAQPDLEILKKRAQRFGENVSSVMKQLEDKEKILKRKSKFGDTDVKNGVASPEEQEKKKKRAERFGL